MAASAGEDRHARTVEALLRAGGLTRECWPAARTALRPRDRRSPAPRRRAALTVAPQLLRQARRHGAARQGGGLVGRDHWEPDHPVQQLALDTVATLTDVPRDKIALATDGCGVVTFGIPLRGLALAFARLADPSDVDDPALRLALERIRDAMMAHPELVGGERRNLDTSLMRAAPGALVSRAAPRVHERSPSWASHEGWRSRSRTGTPPPRATPAPWPRSRAGRIGPGDHRRAPAEFAAPPDPRSARRAVRRGAGGVRARLIDGALRGRGRLLLHRHRGRRRQAWPRQLAARLADLDLDLVANLAVNGSTAGRRGDRADARPGGLAPELASLLVGVNDVVQGVPEERYGARVSEILDGMLQLLPACACSPWPRRTTRPAGRAAPTGCRSSSRRVLRNNEILRGACEYRGITYVADIFEISAGAPAGRHAGGGRPAPERGAVRALGRRDRTGGSAMLALPSDDR